MSNSGNISAPLTPELIESTGLKNFTQDQINRSVYITNLSAKASLKNVSDFFSFCGDIERIILNQHPEHGDNQFSVVLFEDESAFSTALLLGNAVIVDQPITVVGYSSVAPDSHVDQPILADPSTSSRGENTVPAVSAIAGLIAKGYITGETAINDLRQQAHALDEQTSTSKRLNMAYAISMEKAKQFDETIQLTNTIHAFRSNVQQSLDEFEEQYQLRAQTEAVVKTVRDTTLKAANEFSQKALEIEPIKQGWDWLSGGWNSLTATVTGIQKETEQNIARYKGVSTSSSEGEHNDNDINNHRDDPVGDRVSEMYPNLSDERQTAEVLERNNEESVESTSAE